jgi:hypothetical protein
MAYNYRRTGGYKVIGVCGSCERTVYGPMRARVLGTTKQCKNCRGGALEDAADRSEREYFRKMSAEYQLEVQGFVSTP